MTKEKLNTNSCVPHHDDMLVVGLVTTVSNAVSSHKEHSLDIRQRAGHVYQRIIFLAHGNRVGSLHLNSSQY